MRIAVVNGTEKHGITYRLKEMFLAPFRDVASIQEFSLPSDCPGFCTGCISCVVNGEETCKDAQYAGKISQALIEADLIVMTSPAYVFHATGAMKAFLDHMTYLWMPHRPAPEMFGKRAVVLTQCLGAGAKSAAKDIHDSLSWWGISDVRVFSGRLMGDLIWDRLPEKKRRQLESALRKLADKCLRIDYSAPARTGLSVKIRFLFCRLMKRSLAETDPDGVDTAYWTQRGWTESNRPWKTRV